MKFLTGRGTYTVVVPLKFVEFEEWIQLSAHIPIELKVHS